MNVQHCSPIFVVLEGLDGCGKSTLAQALAQALDAELLSTPLPELKSVRSNVDQVLDQTPLARSLWYAAQVVRASDRVRDAKAQGRAVVMDRYWLTTLAYAKRTGLDLDLSEVAQALEKPDAMYFLDVPQAERVRRLRARALAEDCSLQAHDHLSLDAAGALRLKDAYFQAAQRAPLGTLSPISLADADQAEALERVLVCLRATRLCR